MKKPFFGRPQMKTPKLESDQMLQFMMSDDSSDPMDNVIYFYSDVDTESILKLNSQIKLLERKFLSEQIYRNLAEPTPIYLHINSGGGFTFDGLSAMDEILNCKVPIYTVVDGFCASAATFISIVGKKRFMKKHSFMLIHQPSSNFWGTYEEFKDHESNIELIFSCVKMVYSKYTKVLDEELNELLKHDLWWNADYCLKCGLIDEIL
jgi:ATP-dependent protease ClpP protease subunit